MVWGGPRELKDGGGARDWRGGPWRRTGGRGGGEAEQRRGGTFRGTSEQPNGSGLIQDDANGKNLGEELTGVRKRYRRRGWSRGEADATAGRHSAERASPTRTTAEEGENDDERRGGSGVMEERKRELVCHGAGARRQHVASAAQGLMAAAFGRSATSRASARATRGCGRISNGGGGKSAPRRGRSNERERNSEREEENERARELSLGSAHAHASHVREEGGGRQREEMGWGGAFGP
uniref:EBNA1-like protein n=1 Tax=Oryza sativa subsp. japonica TaxID=39947 RepID=Q8S706_ORYSJ|nr:hypothetical protein [Oryza sativa Japonica Group]AAM94530.1 putative EBNA1-like protein [Oryza sativa Japonica Group]